MSLSSHPHVHVHVSVSPRLALPFYFTHFLPHSFHFLLHLKFVDYNLLRAPHNESMDLSDEFLLSTTVSLPQSSAADQAHLRSHAGPCASDVFCGAPTQKEFEVELHLFRNLVLERFRLPLDVTDAVCECGCRLDTEGRHRAVCARSGRLRTRAVGPERTLARIAVRRAHWSDATPNSVT